MALCPSIVPVGGAWHVLELCAGAGGLGLGIKLAVPGARGVAYVEREAAAAATLVTRMEAGDLAAAPVWSDLASFDGRPWRGRVHCVASGDPCQPNSVAGKGLGADDERFLIDQVLRIVDEVRPLRLFRENVTGNADGQLAALVGPLEGMGYRVECGIFSSAATGNSHGRKRLVVMADMADACDGQFPQPWRGPQERGGAGKAGSLGDAPRGHGEGDRECEAYHGASRERQYRGSGVELVDTPCDGRREGRPEHEFRGGRSAASSHCRAMVDAERARRPAAGRGRALDAGTQPVAGSGELADTDRTDAQGRRSGGDTGGREVEARHARLVGGGVGAIPATVPGPADPRWAAILDADPFLAPAIGRFDLLNIARRNLGLPPLVDAIGRRGGLVRDLDADAKAAVEREVRRMADAMADRVERLRQLGNGVDPVAAWDAWCNLDARHRAARERAAGQPVVRAG